MKKVIFKSEEKDRLDKILADKIESLTRQKAQKAIKNGLVKINSKEVNKPNHQAKEGDKIEITIPKPQTSNLKPQKIDLNIVHEDQDYLIINKTAGLVVHPAPGHLEGTLVNAILHHLRNNLSKRNDPTRPGIVHRLDKDTSGVLVIAKNDPAHANLAKQIEGRTVKKTYITLVNGVIDHKGRVEAPIGRNPSKRKDMTVLKQGKMAITEFKPIEVFESSTLLEIDLKTGRTHQIRVHLSSIGHPVIGDEKYGKSKINSQFKELGLTRQFLHAAEITFKDMRGKEVTYKAKLPQNLEELIEKLQ